MRALVLESLAFLAMPALAQSVLDGKARLAGAPAEALAKGVATTDQVRAVIVTAISDRFSADETDLFNELASGNAVDVLANGTTTRVGPLTGEALAVAKLVAAPPNLNTLWKQNGEPTLQLIEMSRWGAAGRSRVVQFMTNKLQSAWSKSTATNGYIPWVEESSGIGNAFDRIQDAEVREEGKLLLKAAIEDLYVRAKAEGWEPPNQFLMPGSLFEVGYPKAP